MFHEWDLTEPYLYMKFNWLKDVFEIILNLFDIKKL